MSGVDHLISEALKALPEKDARAIKAVLDTKLQSEESKQKEAAEARQNKSIHPRVVNGKTKFNKVNTCTPKGKPNPKKIARMEEHIKEHPNDGASRKHLAALLAA